MARVGDRVISVEDFRRSYETGFAHLKTGNNPKLTYLKYMINELLLAKEGYRLGFDQSPFVKHSMRRMLNELLIDELIERKVKQHITISMDEIREAINKSKVSFKFRYWVENDAQKAAEISAEMKERGYADVVDELIHSNPEVQINPKSLETRYLTWQQVTPEVFNAIKDLPYGDISDPVEINGKFYIFQVLDIRRKAVTENEYIAKAPTFRKILYQQKLQEGLLQHGTHLMNSKKVVTKKEAFNLLLDAVREWQKKPQNTSPPFVEAVHKASTAQPGLYKLKQHLAESFFTWRDGRMSIKDFLNHFETDKINKKLQDARGLTIALHKAVALTIRDYFLEQEARRLNLQNAPGVKKELARWQDKWVFEETWQYLTRDVQVDSGTVRAYFQAHRSRYQLRKDQPPRFSDVARQVKNDAYHQNILNALNKNLNELSSRYPVHIYRSVLDTITIIDFKKSRWANLQLFRTGSNRLAYPTVNPLWSMEIGREADSERKE